MPITIMRETVPFILYGKCIILCILCGLSIGCLGMLVNIWWRNGLGIILGGMEIGWDYCVTVVFYYRQELIYWSPLTMTRMGCLSHSQFNYVLPTFEYACSMQCFLAAITIILMHAGIKKYEFV